MLSDLPPPKKKLRFVAKQRPVWTRKSPDLYPKNNTLFYPKSKLQSKPHFLPKTPPRKSFTKERNYFFFGEYGTAKSTSNSINTMPFTKRLLRHHAKWNLLIITLCEYLNILVGLFFLGYPVCLETFLVGPLYIASVCGQSF